MNKEYKEAHISSFLFGKGLKGKIAVLMGMGQFLPILESRCLRCIRHLVFSLEKTPGITILVKEVYKSDTLENNVCREKIYSSVTHS